MTLINARRRLQEMGWEIERDDAGYKYRCRRVGAPSWMRGNELDVLLEAARRHENGHRRKDDPR